MRFEYGVDLLHAYQRIPINRMPFVLSFDSLLPFWPRPHFSEYLYSRLFGLLASSHCRALLPHSHNALAVLKSRNQQQPAFEKVVHKARVVYPVVCDYSAAISPVNRQGIPRVIFVGRQFFIKGGHLMLNAIKRLRQRFAFEVTVVSSLDTSDWTTVRTLADVEKAKSLIAELDVEYHESLPNVEVRKLMGQSDILLLPSIDETFGFVLLEAMAAQLAIIATSIRAIPEIVKDGISGIPIQVRTNQEGVLIRNGTHESEIEAGIEQALGTLLSNPELLHQLKAGARNAYLQNFQPTRLQADLAEVYQQSLLT